MPTKDGLWTDEELFGTTAQLQTPGAQPFAPPQQNVLSDEEVFGRGNGALPLVNARREAVADIESGGRYETVGPPDKYGDRPYGKYQIMGKNIGPWSEEVFGRRVSLQEFRAKPEIQDAIFDFKFGGYANKHGEEGAARAWIGGEGSINRPSRRDSLGTSVASYGQRYKKSLQQLMTPARDEELLAQATPPTQELSAKTLLSDKDVFGDLPGGTLRVEGIEEQHNLVDLARGRRQGGVAPLQGPVVPPPSPVDDSDPLQGPLELAKGVPRGLKETMVASPLVAAGVGFAGTHQKILDVMRRVDAGEQVREIDDVVGYQQMTPEQRAAAKAQVEEQVNRPLTEQPLVKAGKAVSEFGSDVLGPKKGWEKSLWGDVGQGFGSVAGNIIVSRLLGPVGGSAFMMLGGGGEAAANAFKNQATPEQVQRATALGTLPGLTDLADNLLVATGSTGRAIGLLRKVGERVLKGAFIEGGQEGVQQVMQNAIAKGIYKPDQDIFEEVPRNMLVGAIVGGTVSGVAGALEGTPKTDVPASEAEIAAAVAPPLGAPPAAPSGWPRGTETWAEPPITTPSSPVPSGLDVAAVPPPPSPTPTAPAAAPLVPDTPSEIETTIDTLLKGAPDLPMPEPWQDIALQLEDLHDPHSDRRAVYVTKETIDHLRDTGFIADLEEQTFDDHTLMNFDRRGGILIARDNQTAEQAVKEQLGGIPQDQIIGRMTGWGIGKPPDGSLVVEAIDGHEGVVKGRIVSTKEEAAQVVDEFRSQGHFTRIVSPQDHLMSRAGRLATEKQKFGKKKIVEVPREPGEMSPKVVDFLARKRGKIRLPKDQTPPSTPDPNAPLREDREISARAGTNFRRVTAIIGQNMYGDPSKTPEVSVKEMFQNSVDAIRPLLSDGRIEEGKIEIDVDRVNNKITFTDNGIGMLPEDLAGPFLRIAETKKESKDSGGGLGLAKMQFIYSNESLSVTTMRNGEVSVLITTGEALKDAADGAAPQPKIQVRKPTASDWQKFPQGHGTHVEIIVPKKYRDAQGEMKQIVVDSWLDRYKGLIRSPLYKNIRVIFNKQEVQNVGATFDQSRFAPFTQIKAGWGKAVLYVSKEPVDGGLFDPNLHVLSQGLWQFSISIPKKVGGSAWDDKVPRQFYLDLQPSVPADDFAYPIAANRQDFSPTIGGAFQNLFKYLSLVYQNEELGKSSLNFGDIEYLRVNESGDARPSEKMKLTPKPIPEEDKSILSRVRFGQAIEVRDEKLFINGKELPPLTREEIEKATFDPKEFKVDQREVDVNSPILHDNTVIELSEIEEKSLSTMARERFGGAFDNYMHGIGAMYLELRRAIAQDVPGYEGIEKEAVGVSFDLGEDGNGGYRGVSIRVPFDGMFINPAAPESRDPVVGPLGMITTMVHEAAHHVHRSEDHLAPHLQKIWAHLDASPTFDFLEFKQRFVALNSTYGDIYTFLTDFGHGSPFPVRARGNRLQTGSNEARNERGASIAPSRSLGERGGPEPIGGLGGLGAPRAESRRTESRLGVKTSGTVATEIERNQRILASESRDPGVEGVAVDPLFQKGSNVIHVAFGGGRGVGNGPPSGPITPGGSAAPPSAASGPIHASKFYRWYKYMLGIDRLVDRNPFFTPLLRFYEKINAMHRDESTIQDIGLRIGKRWARLSKTKQEALAALIDDVTNMVYRTPNEVRRGASRHPTPAEFGDLVRKHAVTADTLKVYNDVKQSFDVFLQLLQDNAIEEAKRLVKDKKELADRIDGIRSRTDQLKKRPYFPFMRFGTHWINVRDANGDVVFFTAVERMGLKSAETVQQEVANKLRAKLNPGEQVFTGIFPETVKPFVGLPPELLESVARNLTLTPEQTKALQNLQYEMAPAASFKHRFQHKDYTPGYSYDFLRAYSRYFFHGARYYAKSKHAPLMREDLNAAETVSKSLPNGNKEGAIFNYMTDVFQNVVMDAKGDYGLLKGFIFLWTFGGSLAGAALNLSQIPGVSLPFLSAKFGGLGSGDAKASKALITAMTKTRNFYKKGAYDNASEFEMRAFEYGIKTGRVTEAMAAELAGLAQGNNLRPLGNNRAQRGIQWIMQKSTIFFEMAEQFNRRVTYAAALDLAQKNPNALGVKDAMIKYEGEYDTMVKSGKFTPAEARSIIAAVHATEQTQFVYARYARAKFMRGKTTGAIFVFKHYMISMLQLMGGNKSDVMPRMLLMMWMMSGTMGLPGAEEAEDIAHLLGKWLFGKDFKASRELRKFIMEVSDGTIPPDIILHGFSRKGFGIPAMLDAMGSLFTGRPGRGLGPGPAQNVPAPVTDMSRSLGMGRILPVEMGKLLSPNDPVQTIGEQAQRASGAAFGVGFNFYRSIFDREHGGTDLKRWERSMPRALASASKAFRAYTEERERGGKGKESGSTIIRYDPRDAEQLMEIVALGLGFQPTRQTAQWDLIRAQTEVDKFFKVQRGMLLDQFDEARLGGDAEERRRVINAIREYNRDLPKWAKGNSITPETVERSVITRQTTRGRRELGLPATNSSVGTFRHIQELFPEATVDVRKVPR